MRTCLLQQHQRWFRKSDKSKNEKNKGFLMSPPTERRDFALCWPRWLNVRGHVNSWEKGPYHWYRSLRLIHSFRMFDDPSYSMDRIWNYDTRSGTVGVGVRMRAHTLNEQVLKFGRMTVYTFAKKTKQCYTRKTDKSKNEQSKAFLMTPPTGWIRFVLCWPRW